MKWYMWGFVFLSSVLGGCNRIGPTSQGETLQRRSSELVAFDRKLEAIDSPQTAEEAVSFFVDRVKNNLSGPTGNPSVSGLASISGRSLIANMAAVELLARGHRQGTRILSDEDYVSTEKLADVLSETVASDGSQRTITEAQVKMTQDVVRQNIPHLATEEGSSAMTPLEASVLAYYMLTGDIGDDTSESVEPLDATESDLVKFVEKIQ